MQLVSLRRGRWRLMPGHVGLPSDPCAASDSRRAMSSELPLCSSSVSLSSSMNFCMIDHCSIVSRSGSLSRCCTISEAAWRGEARRIEMSLFEAPRSSPRFRPLTNSRLRKASLILMYLSLFSGTGARRSQGGVKMRIAVWLRGGLSLRKTVIELLGGGLQRGPSRPPR